MTDPNDPMAEIRASFFIECEELLEALQDGLQAMDEGTDDPETINVVFRAVHSIKGGAGAFGLEALVRFAHRFETVLDDIRTGRRVPDGKSLKLFYRCADHLLDLVHVSRDEGIIPEADTERLLERLDETWDANDASISSHCNDTDFDFQPTAISLDLDLDLGPPEQAKAKVPDTTTSLEAGAKHYLIKFKPENELFETGNEPFLMLRALDEMGECKVTCDTSNMPLLTELAPETSYLSWTVDLLSTVDAAEIASAFEFVEGLCQLEIALAEEKASAPQNTSNFEVEASGQIESQPTQFCAAASDQQDSDTSEGVLSFSAPKTAQDTDETPQAKQSEAVSISASAPAKSVVRVDLDRIEKLVNLVGELVINQAMLSQSLQNAGLSPHSDAMSGLEEFQRLTRDIQDSVMMIRAQPVKSLFQRMSRIVREASAALDKDVRLVTEGEATEVDKTVIERLADPLTHMIRNAVDHGLESTQARLSTGKPPQGQVKLTAAHRSGRVIIEVSDDGGGIDRSRVLRIAKDKGLVAPDATLSENEIDNLLFLPGFSTSNAISDLSGRGVGMDVVRTSIQDLGGKISISSTPGTGTTFAISLPLTLAVLDGMVVQVAGETVVLPLNTVIETLTLTNDDVEMIRPGANVVRVRTGIIPLFDLGHELGFRAPVKNYDGSVVLVVAHEDDERAALIIDDIQDQRQVVIKGLNDSFYRAPGIAAATILGDGQIALILDTSDIIASALDKNGPSLTNQFTGLSA